MSLEIFFGIGCWRSSGNKISGNNIDSNEEFGILIQYSDLNIISANNIINNTILIISSLLNIISANNIMNNTQDVYFCGLLSLQNRWNGNYWDKEYLIKPILGEFWMPISVDYWGNIKFLRIPLVKFDIHPAQEPYDIS